MLERFNRLMNIIQYLPWIEIFIDLWRVGNKAIRGLSVEGMYEVLEYESTLELKDSKGKHALSVRKSVTCKTILLPTRIRHGEMAEFYKTTDVRQAHQLISTDREK